jgi:hypothetical protein
MFQKFERKILRGVLSRRLRCILASFSYLRDGEPNCIHDFSSLHRS